MPTKDEDKEKNLGFQRHKSPLDAPEDGKKAHWTSCNPHNAKHISLDVSSFSVSWIRSN